ncbi:hypothetical protein H0H93_010369 [Arthromyces matolae]|nr:hypothetical protein H0H93_010369 [Arthromyces matolae]
MPSPAVSLGLLEFYHSSASPEAPWNYPAWQELTGVRHGLFPKDDSLLPRGWSRQQADDIQSFFVSYSLQPATNRAKFFKTSQHPGRRKFASWVTSRWTAWGVHDIVVKALREADAHPSIVLLRENNLENPEAAWPSSTLFSNAAIEPVCLLLFGEDACVPNTDFITTAARNVVVIFIQRSWDTIRVQFRRVARQRKVIEEAAIDAFKALEESKPTKGSVTVAIKAAARWRDAAELLGAPTAIERAKGLQGQLQAIMEGLGIDVEKRVTSKLSHKVSIDGLNSLATDQNVSDIANTYRDYFERIDQDDQEIALDVSDDKQTLNDAGGDFGVDIEHRLSLVQLLLALGWKDGLPPIFNAYRHRRGENPWDKPQLFDHSEQDLQTGILFKFSLHWHQLAGVHSLVRSSFTSEPSSSVGILIADEVGLGKTAQAVAYIAFMNMVISLQQAKRKLPKVLTHAAYLGVNSTVPSLPHLIICSGTLLSQWVSELKAYLKPNSVDLFVYDGSAVPQDFWSPQGPFHQSKHELHNRVIIAAYAAITRDMNSIYNKTPKKIRKSKEARMPWDMPSLNSKGNIELTIYGQNFLVGVLDEAHNFRNEGRKQLSMIRLLQNVTVRLPMTATPLHTGTKDISAMLRLAGILHFFDPVSVAEEKEDASILRRAKRQDTDGQAVLEAQLQAVSRLQTQAAGRLLRRTVDSRDYKGDVLIPLPPLIEIVGILFLTDREKELMKKCHADAALLMEDTGSTSPRDIKSNASRRFDNFYTGYRVEVIFSKDPNEPYPSFETLDAWEAMKSTKLDALAHITRHYLSHDNVEDVAFENGALVIKPCVLADGEAISQRRRIIIFSNFSSQIRLIQNVRVIFTSV